MELRNQLDTKENREFSASMALELLNFGKNFPSPGGGAFYLGIDGTPLPEKPRETWITARMLHVYSIGTRAGIEGCRELAESALAGLRGELRDAERGGWYAGITGQNRILPGKQCYAHAFVILAAAGAVPAGLNGAESLLKEALDVYDRFFWSEEDGLSADFWDTEFKHRDEYRGLNSNMHSVEAFLAAADILKDDKYRLRAGRIIQHVVQWAEEFDYRLPEHFTSSWVPVPEMNQDRPDDPFKPYGATPGHGLEWARLIIQWTESVFGEVSSEAALTDKSKYIDCAVKLYDRAVKDGWNCDGSEGFVYTTDWNGNAVVHDRMHWTLAEAINTSAVLYRITGKSRYAEDYGMFLRYLEEKVHDKAKGSWYHQLDEHNRIKETVWPGKPDLYHAFQAMLIPYCTPSLSVAVEGADILRKDIQRG